MAIPLLNSFVSNIEKSAFGTLSSLIGGSLSNHATRSMMRFQDSLNDQNALDAYNRQRSLMEDSASIQKRGMIKAGYNTAFGSNGSVMSVSTPSSSSVGLGSVDTNNMPTSFQSMLDAKDVESNAKVADSHSRLLDSQTQGQLIDNDYKAANAIADLSNKAANTRDANAKAHLNEITANLEKKWGDRAYGAAVGKAESDASAAVDNAAIVGLNRQIEQATYDDKVALAHELLENEKKKGKLLDAQVIVENGIPRIQESEIAKNYASADRDEAGAYESRKHGALYDTENDIKREGKADTLAILKSGRIKAWYDAQPHDMQQVMMSSYGFRDALAKVQRGEDLDAHDKAVLAAVLGYENAGKLTSLLLDAIKVRKTPKAAPVKRTIVEHRSSKK